MNMDNQNTFVQPPLPPPGGIMDSQDVLRDFLRSEEWPEGLITTALNNSKYIASRYMILDDSGSMSAVDGQKFDSRYRKMISCKRWDELKAAVEFHASFASAGKIPTEFVFLNGGQSIIVGDKNDEDNTKKNELFRRLDRGPGGLTPLCEKVREVARKVQQQANELRKNGEKASITIFTDGKASDGDIEIALKQLLNLPVWVCIRLCTDEEDVGSYWNQVDDDIELPMDVLDDLKGEALEVTSRNPWLVYGMPLHRLREGGIHLKVLDSIDERPLVPAEIPEYVSILLGGKKDDITHPSLNKKDFVSDCMNLANKERAVWDPISKKDTLWIKESYLKVTAGVGCCTIM